MKLTQTQAIQKHLQDGNSITEMEALNMFGCFRLASRIYDIKQNWVKVVKEMIGKRGASFASYRVA